MSDRAGIFEDRKTCRISGDVFFESQYKRSYYTYVFVFQISYWWQSGQPSLKRHGQENVSMRSSALCPSASLLHLSSLAELTSAPLRMFAQSEQGFFLCARQRRFCLFRWQRLHVLCLCFANDVSPEKSEPNPMSIVIATSENRCGENIAYLCKRYSIAKESLPPDNPTAIRSPSFIIPNTLIVFRNSLSIFALSYQTHFTYFFSV